MSTKNVYDSLLEFIPVEELINKYGEIFKHIKDYFNSRSDILCTRNIGERIVYGNEHINSLMNICGFTEADVKTWIDRSSIYKGFKNITKTRHIVPCLLTMVFYKNRKKILERYPELDKPNITEPWKVINMYFTTIVISTIQGKYFKFAPDPRIWQATLENLSGKYILKKVSNLMEFIEKYADLAATTYEKELQKADDQSVCTYINSMVNYMNSSIKNINNEFQKNYESGNKVENEAFMREYEDGKVDLNVQTSISNDIEITVRNIINRFTQDPVVSRVLLEIACKSSNCSPSKIEPIIGYIRYKNTDKFLYGLVSNIVKYYISTKQKAVSDIKTDDFVKTMLTAYQISNTYDPFILEIKSILNEILTVYGDEFTSVGGRQTLQNSRMCIYIYMVLYIRKNQ